MEAVLLAPTAMNQQKFYITLERGKALARAVRGFYTKMDLGIVKCHFEAARLPPGRRYIRLGLVFDRKKVAVFRRRDTETVFKRAVKMCRIGISDGL